MADETKKGLEGVIVADSTKSMVDGINGTLLYGGYRIEDLARNASFEEVLYLLWHDRLPNAAELEAQVAALAEARTLPEPVIEVLRQLPADTHPMAALRTGVSALAPFDPDGEDANSEESVRIPVMTRIAAAIPTLITTFEHLRNGREPIAPRADLGHSANFLYMLSGQEAGPAAVRAVDAYLVLLADHGLNASTFSARTQRRSKWLKLLVQFSKQRVLRNFNNYHRSYLSNERTTLRKCKS